MIVTEYTGKFLNDLSIILLRAWQSTVSVWREEVFSIYVKSLLQVANIKQMQNK